MGLQTLAAPTLPGSRPGSAAWSFPQLTAQEINSNPSAPANPTNLN
jgi:hypothetical protein